MCIKKIEMLILIFFSVLLAVAVPTIGPFIALIGALCFSFLGLIIPLLIEIVTYWDVGFGPCNWVIIKNIFLFIFGVLALIFGSYTSIVDIVKLYVPQDEVLNGHGFPNTTYLPENVTDCLLYTSRCV